MTFMPRTRLCAKSTKVVSPGVGSNATGAFAACGCRDYARIDFMLSPRDELFLLEINTLPGMKDTSLLPMSARCAGLDFTQLVRELVGPALRRFRGGIC
jgi:D-alanine-D-alanine ligase